MAKDFFNSPVETHGRASYLSHELARIYTNYFLKIEIP